MSSIKLALPERRGEAMVCAEDLIGQIRRELEPVEARIRDHPYLQALDQGQILKERLGIFVGEQHITIESDLRSVASMVARSEHPRTRRFFLSILPGEDAAFGALHDLATALGLDEPWLQAYEPTPEAQAYGHFVAWLACYGSPAEMATALAVNFPAWGANCGRVGAALRDNYGLSKEATAFFDLFSGPTPSGFEEGVRSVTDDGLRRGVGENQMKRAARLLQSYELMFWDGVHRASTLQ